MLGAGNFERPIGVYRMAYSYVGEATTGQPLVYWGPHTAREYTCSPQHDLML